MSVSSYFNCAICWNNSLIETITMSISGFLLSLSSEKIVFKNQSAGNQRRILRNLDNYNSLRFKYSLVETSETTRTATCYNINFYQWLAGLIDGDGCLLVSKKGYTSLEIIVSLEDLPMLRFIQNKLGGKVKIRSKTYRYRLIKQESINILVNNINGYIRHSTRLQQLHRVCLQLNCTVKIPIDLTKESTWFAGFFDAEGTITYSIKNKYSHPQLTVSVTNKKLEDVKWFKDIFGGYIYYDNSQNGYYKWTIQSKKDILNVAEYFNKNCKSNKAKRFYLVENYYSLKSIKTYNIKLWEIFNNKWSSK